MGRKLLNGLHGTSNHQDEGIVKFMNGFKGIVERIKSLEAERRNLVLEIDELKKMADSKAKALENEVSMLREEVKSLRVLLGAGEPELDPEPKRKQAR